MTMRGKLHAVGVYDEFMANRDRLTDHAWITAWLQPHCKRLAGLGWRGTRLRILQIPSEFASWLILMGQRQCKTYLEIGTSTGGSFFTTDSYLRAVVPGFRGSLGYDRHSKMRDWDEYVARFPTCVFKHEGSGEMNLRDLQFDAALIDARHVKKWVLHDYRKVLPNAALIAFHDIVLEGASVGEAWHEIRTRHQLTWEFVDLTIPVEARCGIGVLAR